GVDVATDVAIQPDGNIVVVGFTSVGNDFAVARVLANGSGLDASFDADGKVTIDLGGTDEAHGVVVQPDGKIVVAGSTSSNNDFAVARLNADGSLDATFDTDGKVTPTFGGVDVGRDVALQPD